MKLFIFETLDSTMITAREFIDTGRCREEFCILAMQQTSGVGTYGRIWLSPYGNFYASFVFSLETIDLHPITSIYTGMALVDVLNQFTCPVKLKWSNDLLFQQQKISGILCEAYRDYLIVGVGINIMTCPELSPSDQGFFKPLSLKKAYPDHTLPDHKTLAEIIADKIYQYFKLAHRRENFSLYKLWELYSASYNKKIEFLLPDNGIVEGLEKGISQEGFLIIEQQKDIGVYHSGRILKITEYESHS